MGMTSTQRWILTLAALAAFMTALDTLVVTTALSTIRTDLGASVEGLEWTVNAYNLSFAVLLMTAAAVGDRLGRRRLFVAGIAVFGLASAACALAPSVGALIAARAAQGVGAALVTTLALTLISAAFPPERRGAALGVFFAVNGLAVAGGPLVGGAVTEGIAWEWIFWLNVPIAAVLIPLALTRIPESRGPDTALDLPGLALVTGGMFGVVWGLVRGNPAGWGSAEVLVALLGGLGLIAAFVAWQLRAREPMLPMRFFRSRAFSAGNAAIAAAVAGLFCAVFFVSQFLQVGLGSGPLEAGLRQLPWTATLFFVAPVAGILVDRFGERPFLIAGPLLQAAGMGWIALIADASHDLLAADRADDRGRRGHLDDVPGRAELRGLVGARVGAGQGLGHQLDDARAGRGAGHRARRGRVRGRRQLRLAGGVHRRLQRRAWRVRRAVGAGRPGGLVPARARAGGRGRRRSAGWSMIRPCPNGP